MTHE
jgi:hypothetical protein